MATTDEALETTVRKLSQEESLALFDKEVRNRMGMSGDEFRRRLNAGEFDEIIDDPINHPGITYLVMLSDIVY